LTIFCNVLSAEVQELGAEPTAAEVARGLEKGAAHELHNSVVKEMKEAYGAKIFKDALPEHVYGELSPDEKEAFTFIHGLTKEYESMTGKKLSAGKFKAGGKPKNEISQTIADMSRLSKKMYAGKPPKLPSAGITSHTDLVKEMMKVSEEKQYAFNGIPKPSKNGGNKLNKEVVDTEGGNLPTAEEAARQASLKTHAKRMAAKKNKDSELAAEKAEARKLDLEAEMPIEELIQLGADPAPKKEAPKKEAKPPPPPRTQRSQLPLPARRRSLLQVLSQPLRARRILSPSCINAWMIWKIQSSLTRRSS